MADQAFSFFERRAFWEAHAKRCGYCRDPLGFSNLEIDHILPESLERNPEEWERVSREQGVPPDFDLRSYGNLVASCPECNARKRANAFAPGRTAIELATALKLAPKVEALRDRFMRQDRADRVRFSLAGALQSGEMSKWDVDRVVSEAMATAGVLQLDGSFDLFGGDGPINALSKSEYDSYLDKHAALPSDMIDGLRLVNNKNSEVFVHTFREYREAIARGYFALSSFEMSVAYTGFEEPLNILRLLRIVRPPMRSFISNPHCGLADISLLPATLLFVTEEMTSDEAFAGQRDRLKGKSIRDVVASGEARIVDIATDLLAIDYDNGRTFMFEIMRGDFDGDGSEDMVVRRAVGPLGGTYRSAYAAILTRLSLDEGFIEIPYGNLPTDE